MKGGSDPKDGDKKPVEEESLEAPSTDEVVPEVTEVTVQVEDELKKEQKKRKTAAMDDPYMLMPPMPKKKPKTLDRAEQAGSSKKVVVSNEGNALPHAHTKTGILAKKPQRKEKSVSPQKKEAGPDEDSEMRSQSSETATRVQAAVAPQAVQSCKAIEDARREGIISSIQRCLMDPSVRIQDLEDILVRPHQICEAGREDRR